MSRGWLLNWIRRWVLSASDLTDNGHICCLDQMWLRKAADVAEGKRGHMSRGRKRPATAGLFFDFSGGWSMTAVSNVLLSLSRWHTRGRWTAVTNRLERLTLPLESLLQREMGRSWARKAIPQIFLGWIVKTKEVGAI